MDSIFAYSDYRVFLRDYYAEKKRLGSGYSLKVLSDKAGFKARDYIMRVMNGSRNLSGPGAFMVSRALRLTAKERKYFENMVAFCQAKRQVEREHYFEEMNVLSRGEGYQLMRQDQFECFANWYTMALQTLLPALDAKTDPARAGKMLDPPLGARDSAKAVDLLLRLGLLTLRDDGSCAVCAPAMSTGDEVRSTALLKFHRDVLDLAKRSIDSHPASERDISGLTMSISPRAFAEIKSEIQVLRKKIMSIAQNDSGEDRVYQLSVCLFPLSKRFSGKGANVQ